MRKVWIFAKRRIFVITNVGFPTLIDLTNLTKNSGACGAGILLYLYIRYNTGSPPGAVFGRFRETSRKEDCSFWGGYLFLNDTTHFIRVRGSGFHLIKPRVDCLSNHISITPSEEVKTSENGTAPPEKQKQKAKNRKREFGISMLLTERRIVCF